MILKYVEPLSFD